MKPTIELPDDLVATAKKLAIERRTTLRELVERELRWEITSSAKRPAHPLTVLGALDRGIRQGTEADRHVAAERAGWE